MKTYEKDDTLYDVLYVTKREAAAEIDCAIEHTRRLRQAIRETLMENLHLADGDVCTLKRLKDAIGFDLDEALNQKSPKDAIKGAAPDLFSGPMKTAMVFAARYTHNRPTAGAHAIVRALEQCWHVLDDQTRAMILRESYEAGYNLDDWQRLRDFAKRMEATKEQCPKCGAIRTYCDGWNCPTDGCDENQKQPIT